MWNYTRNEWGRCENTLETIGLDVKTTLQTSGEDVKTTLQTSVVFSAVDHEPYVKLGRQHIKVVNGTSVVLKPLNDDQGEIENNYCVKTHSKRVEKM